MEYNYAKLLDELPLFAQTARALHKVTDVGVFLLYVKEYSVVYAGSLMSIAWGVLIPIGIILALFYKVVWPNGHWFYVSQYRDSQWPPLINHTFCWSPDSHFSDGGGYTDGDSRTVCDPSSCRMEVARYHRKQLYTATVYYCMIGRI